MIWIWAICADLGFRSRSSGRLCRRQPAGLSGGLLLFCMPLCVYDSQQWENAGFGTHKRKPQLFLNTRPSSSCLPQPCALSLLQLPLPTGHLLFFLLFWSSITFLSPFTLFLMCCDTVPSAWASLSLPSSPHSLSFAQTQATHPLNTWCISTYSLALLVLPLGVFLWWHQSGFDYVLPWVPLVPLSWH